MFHNYVDVSAGDFDPATATTDELAVAEAAGYGAYANCTVDGHFPPVEIRASFLRHLLLGFPALMGQPWPIAPGGVKVCGATVTGALNLRDGRLPSGDALPPLLLEFCSFNESIILDEAHFRRLSFRGSNITAISAEGCSIDGQLVLADIKPTQRAGVPESSRIDLRRCRIGSGLDVEGARLVAGPTAGPDHFALNLTGARVSGEVCGNSLFADGGISLREGQFSNSVNFNGLTCLRPNTISFDADTTTIDGGLELGTHREIRSTITGSVRIYGATIKGNFNLESALLHCPDGATLIAMGATIGGHILICSGLESQGELDLRAVRVKGSVDVKRAKLQSRFNSCIDLASAQIGGDLHFGLDFTANGTIAIVGATIEGSLILSDADILPSLTSEDEKASAMPSPPSYDAINATNASIKLDCRIAHLRTHGTIRLWGATVGQTLSVANADSSPEWILRDCSVGQIDDNNAKGWGKKPTVRADGFRYDALSPTSYFGENVWTTRKRWLKLIKSPGGTLAPQPYEQVAKVLFEMGHVSESRQATIYLNGRRTRHLPPLSLRQPFTSIFRLMVFVVRLIFAGLFGICFAYGYSPPRAALTFLFFVGLGTLGASYANSSDLMIVNGSAVSSVFADSGSKPHMVFTKTDGAHNTDKIPCGDSITPFWYAVDLFVPLVDLNQEKQCIAESVADRPPLHVFGVKLPVFDTWFLRSLTAIYALLGAVVTSLTILTFSGVLRRDLRG